MFTSHSPHPLGWGHLCLEIPGTISMVFVRFECRLFFQEPLLKTVKMVPSRKLTPLTPT